MIIRLGIFLILLLPAACAASLYRKEDSCSEVYFARSRESDTQRAIEICKTQGDNGDPRSYHLLAGIYREEFKHDQRDKALSDYYYHKAFDLYKEKAEKADIWAQNVLGHIYLDGPAISHYAVPQDINNGLYWMEKAANVENAPSLSERQRTHILTTQDQLANLYLRGGDGVPKDEKKAFYWFKRSADDFNNWNAHRTIGISYIKGTGTEKDYIEAYKYIILSHNFILSSSEPWKKELAKMMTPDQIAEAERRAEEWKREYAKR